MRKIYFTAYLLLFVLCDVAYAQPTYNGANQSAFFNGRTSAQLRAFANRVDTAWVSGWADNFTLSSQDSLDFNHLDSRTKSQFVCNLLYTADQKDAGLTIDFTGFSVSGSGTASTHYVVHSDCVISWCCPTSIAVSFYTTHSRN